MGAIVGGAGHNAGWGNRNASRSRSGQPGPGVARRTGVRCIDRGGTQVNMGPRPRKLQLLRWLPGAIVKSRGPARDNAMECGEHRAEHPQWVGGFVWVSAMAAAAGDPGFELVGGGRVPASAHSYFPQGLH